MRAGAAPEGFADDDSLRIFACHLRLPFGRLGRTRPEDRRSIFTWNIRLVRRLFAVVFDWSTRMKFTKPGLRSANYGASVALLVEALPWIKNTTGKTILIKYGGSAMEDPELMREVMADIVLLKIIGAHPIIVHGGGKDISAAFERANIPVQFKDGLRVTPDDAMELVRMVLVGNVNRRLVDALNEHGHLAVGASGGDACTIRATQADPDLGRVGEITSIDPTYLERIVEDDYIPIVATVAAGDDGKPFNINADIAAGKLAAALHAHKVIFLTDVDGLYADFPNKDSLISSLTAEEARGLIGSGALSSGMIPKIEACLSALDAGIPRCHIVNGTMPHSILLELLTDHGIGTMIYNQTPDETYQAQPLDALASRLDINQQ